MIVQYIIDWGYIHREISKASSDRLAVISINLRGLQKAIRRNGVLFVDERQYLIKGLNDIIKYLEHGEEGEQAMQWYNLVNILKAFRQLYDEYRILLPMPDNENISTFIECRHQFLVESNLETCMLHCAVITDANISDEDSVHTLTIDEYLDSEIENVREGWETVSFNTNDEALARKFWQGLSLCACSFNEVTLYDPYSIGLLRENSQKCACSFQEIFQWFIRNNHIASLRIVCKLDEYDNKVFELERFKNEVKGMMCWKNARRNRAMILKLCVKTKIDNVRFHDRWIDAGAHTCTLSVGLDVYRSRRYNRRYNVIEISRPFSVCAITDVSKQRNAVDAMSCHSYNDISRDVGDQWRSGAVDDTVETDIQPPIFLRIGGLS